MDAIRWVVLFAVVLAVGCGSPESGPHAQRLERGAPTDSPPQELPATSIGNALQLPGAISPLTERIGALTQDARTAQVNGQYAQETALWSEAHTLLVGQFGEQSWQARNAELAMLTARHHASLNQGQLTKLAELFQWQNRIAELLHQNNPYAALTIARGSLERTLELYGENSYLHGKQLIQIARLEQLAGRFDESIETYRQAFATISPWLGRVHPELESIHVAFGEIWLARGDYHQAVENLRVALRMASELYGNNSLQTATRANDLAVALQRSGNLHDAIAYLTKAEEIRRQWLGPEHPHVAHCLLNLGTCNFELQHYEVAREQLEQSLAILTITVQGPNRLLLDCLHKLSITYMLLDKPNQAEPHLRQLVELLRQTSSSATDLGLAEYRWGVCLAKQGKYEDAEPLLKLSLARLENAAGFDHPHTAKPREALRQLYLATNRPSDAQSLDARVQPVSYESDEPKFVRDPNVPR